MAALIAVAACGSDDTSTEGGGSPSPSPTGSTPAASDCVPRCTAKAATCGAPSSMAEPQCATTCEGATEAKVKCLESTGCAALAESFEGGATDLCSTAGGSSSADAGTGTGTGGKCIAVGTTASCDNQGTDPAKKCCNLAACQVETGKCCFPTGMPALACKADTECCRGTCQTDPQDANRRYCQ